jgi:hypothetical protein
MADQFPKHKSQITSKHQFSNPNLPQNAFDSLPLKAIRLFTTPFSTLACRLIGGAHAKRREGIWNIRRSREGRRASKRKAHCARERLIDSSTPAQGGQATTPRIATHLSSRYIYPISNLATSP